MSFTDILKNPEQEGKEKHVPVIEIDKCDGEGMTLVRVIVGKEVPHPNTVEHHIAWIELFGKKKEGQVVCIGKAEFGPGLAKPNARFFVDVNQFEALYALEYCNIHGVWENCVKVEDGQAKCCCGS